MSPLAQSSFTIYPAFKVLMCKEQLFVLQSSAQKYKLSTFLSDAVMPVKQFCKLSILSGEMAPFKALYTGI